MRFAFIHLPKTGGMYVDAALKAGGVQQVYLGPRKHYTLADIASVPEVGPYYSFCCVRHPADWLASLWAHRERKANSSINWWLAELIPHHTDWATFVDQTTDQHQGTISLLMDEFTMGVDLIGRTPNVRAGLIQALNSSGVDYDNAALSAVPPTNVGDNRPTITGQQVSKIEQAEFAILNKFAMDRG